ncbi:acetyltransferase [Nonlabens antarcticus]|uniref:acetyltransferase n=1 Tax=Nonlabens antarcticus TaxID=392714 RepID=UPI001891E795|nr:acetyltransferase [Nonlabens antarcticus]
MSIKNLEKRYFELANELPTIHKDLNFKNHCYWRIVLDKVTADKWSNRLDTPAYKNLNAIQLKQVIERLELYKIDKEQLLIDNLQSLAYRKF